MEITPSEATDYSVLHFGLFFSSILLLTTFSGVRVPIFEETTKIFKQLASQKMIVHCPYNPSHTMPHKTLSLHLTRCPDKPNNYTQCSFNFLHVMPKHQKEEHENNCQDRLTFDEMIYEREGTARPITIIQDQPIISSEESWDDFHPSSSVMEKINQRPNFMKPAYGLTKSQRKKYRNDMQSTYSNVDISYNPNLNIHERQDASSSNNNKNLQKEKQLFIGKRPNI